MHKLKSNRLVGLLVILFIYTLASVVGVVVFNLTVNKLGYWLSVLVADVVATVAVFVFSLLFNNASVYDPYWSVQPMVIVVAYAFRVQQLSFLKIALIVAVLLWGTRLTANWVYTFTGFDYQDWRYVMLKEKTKALYPVVNLLGIHMFPTLVVYLCTMPVVLVLETNATMPWHSLIFVVTAVLSATLQGVADYQMHRYRKNRTTPFIRTGLWKYSRHPNYLGEILMWWSVAFACFVSTKVIWTFTGAVVNTFMFLFVSIPMADKRQSKKEGFEQYKQQTRMLLPFKK